MGTLNNAVRLLAKRPSVFVLTVLFSAVICFVEYVVMTLAYGVSMFKSVSPFDDYVFVIQFMIDTFKVPQMAVKIIMILVISVIFAAAILAVLLSGYFNVLNNAVEGRQKKSGNEFLQGIKKYYLRMLSINLWTICSTILFIIYVLIASIPAAIVTHNALNGAISIFAAIILIIVTAFVIFFSYAFFRQYIAFWYPSSLVYDKNHFKMGKKISDSYFWKLLSKLILFDIVFILFEVLYIFTNFALANQQIVSSVTTTILFLVNLIFKSIFIALLVCFVFTSFKTCNDRYKNNRKPINS